jgi:hypothetical protein
MQIFKIYKDELISLSQEPYYDRGIMPTEAFAFISYCKSFQIDTIIESGTAFGQSCYLYAKYLGINIHTIDNISHYGNKAQAIAKERCKDLPVTFHEGDSNKVLPKLIEQYSNNKIAVFIDGPKGGEAQQLRRKIWSYKNVVIAALHDSVGENEIGKFSSCNHPTFLSEYRDIFDSEVLNLPYPDDISITIGERFKQGMGMDLWYKPRNIIYYVYTGGADDLYNDFIESSKKVCNPVYMCLTNELTNVTADFKTIFTEEEKGATMGPKFNALRRLPLVDGDKVFVSDIDTYFNEDVFTVFDSVVDIGVTSRNKKEGEAAQYSPINAGVWCFRHSYKTEALFDWFYEQLTNPSYDKFINYKRNHPFSKSIGLKEWWVDQDLLNVIYANRHEFLVDIIDISPEYNWIVTDEEYLKFQNNSHKILHRKGGTGNRWKK